MSRTTRQWIAFGAVAGSGILLGIIVHFAITYTWQFVAILVLAWTVGVGFSGRGPWPFNATIKKLEPIHHHAVYLVREFGLPFAFIAGFVYAVHTLHHRGGWWALAVMTGMFFADRLLAKAVAYLRCRIAQRQSAAQPVDEDEPVRVACNLNTDGDR